MLKGDIAIPLETVGMLFFIGAVVSFVIFIQANNVAYSADLSVPQQQIKAVDAAYLVKQCLSEVSDSLSERMLQRYDGKGLCDIPECMLCSPQAGAKVEYLEGPKNGRSFDFGYTSLLSIKKRYEHSIFVNVDDGTSIRMAKLSVVIYG
jgi:hypothetical protein